MTTQDKLTIIREYKELKAMMSELETEAEALKQRMIVEMEALQTDTFKVDYFTVKYTPYKTSRIDTAALKNELPEIAARFTKTTETKRFQVA